MTKLYRSAEMPVPAAVTIVVSLVVVIVVYWLPSMSRIGLVIMSVPYIIREYTTNARYDLPAALALMYVGPLIMQAAYL